MAVGGQASKAGIDASLTDLAVSLRNLAQQARNLETMANANGEPIEALVAVGYSNEPNPDNPGSISDAALAAQYLGYMSTLGGIYYGIVQQGGSNGTGATLFNFDNALSPLWAGRLA